MTKLSHAATRQMLTMMRPMTSLMEREFAASTDDLVFYKEDWVPLYFDRAQVVTSECHTMAAYRAVTLRGQSLWLVFTPSKKKGYHAACADPFDAMEMAKRDWARRRAVRQDWAEVRETAADLLAGRQAFTIRVEDLHASPLCAMGIEGFRRRVGLGRVTRIPGWLGALLMKVEPQMGFVLHAAMQRQAREEVSGAVAPTL